MEGKSRFAFGVVSTGRRPDKTTEPQLVVATTKGKFKLNGAATRMVGVQHGDHAALVNNADEIAKAIAAGEAEEDTAPTWGIIKGYPVLDKEGNPRQSVKRLTDAEKSALIEAGEVDEDGEALTQYEDKVIGFKLASVTKALGFGVTLEGSDAVNYPLLGGNDANNIVYEIEKEPVIVEMAGNDVEVYILGESTEVPKIARG